MKENQLNKNALHYSRVLRKIWLRPFISRIDISKALNLDRSIVTHIVTDLIEFGIVKLKNPRQDSMKGGRRPIPLLINKDFGCVAGLEIQPDYINYTGTNLDGEMLFSKTYEKNTSLHNLYDVFYDLISEVEGECKKNKIPLIGVAAGMPGVINVVEGIIEVSVPLEIHSPLPFVQEVRKKLDFPVLIDNEANCCAYGEQVFGKDKEIDNFLFLLTEFRNRNNGPTVYGGISIGMGIVINQKLYHGKNHSAGEFRSLFRQNPETGQLSLDDDVLGNIENDKEIQKKVIREVAQHIAFLANTFALSKVIVNGDLDTTGLIDAIRAEIRNNITYPDLQNCAVEHSTLHEMPVAHGAAGMFLENLFSLPVVTMELYKDIAIGLESLPGWDFFR
ncbi:MAG: ROK family protein [Spirochaetales bacterium]|nr:ROK family protein [Spirochaetales bacterium]